MILCNISDNLCNKKVEPIKNCSMSEHPVKGSVEALLQVLIMVAGHHLEPDVYSPFFKILNNRGGVSLHALECLGFSFKIWTARGLSRSRPWGQVVVPVHVTDNGNREAVL